MPSTDTIPQPPATPLPPVGTVLRADFLFRDDQDRKTERKGTARVQVGGNDRVALMAPIVRGADHPYQDMLALPKDALRALGLDPRRETHILLSQLNQVEAGAPGFRNAVPQGLQTVDSNRPI